MSETEVELDDPILPLRRLVRRPSSPKSKASSPTIASTPISNSVSALNEKQSNGEKEKSDEKKHSIFGFFTKKHVPPTSLEIPSKSSSKLKADSSVTPSGSLGFLHRFSFGKHSPTTPHSGFPGPYPEGSTNRPTELLFPVKELDSVASEEGTQESSEHPQDNIASSIHDEHWFVPAVTENELQDSMESEKMMTALQVMTEPENTRDMTIKELENFLGDFRSGKLRALTDNDLDEMRQMHKEQLNISALQIQIHDQLLLHGEDEEDEFDEIYRSLGAQLDHLHASMENFSGIKTSKKIGQRGI
uniref:Uncharacterized protein n=1 Tax=Panagrolaimus sp. JU765 TaxID=591449 RepID=A0AC34Q3K6_9BILA